MEEEKNVNEVVEEAVKETPEEVEQNPEPEAERLEAEAEATPEDVGADTDNEPAVEGEAVKEEDEKETV